MATVQDATAQNRKLHNYKQLKEAHVSNLSGGSIWEINEVTLVLPVSNSLTRRILACYFASKPPHTGRRVRLVRLAGEAQFLHPLYGSCSRRRLYHQLRGDLIRNHSIFQ